MAEMLSANFSLDEFQAASHRPLAASEVANARWWAREVLQPARDRLGPLRVTSYVRDGANVGTHGAGHSVDVVPVNVSVRALADWMAVNRLATRAGPGRVVQVIDERTHVHLARFLAPGARAGYLSEPTEGAYVPTTPNPAKIGPGDYRVILAAGLAVVILLVAAW